MAPLTLLALPVSAATLNSASASSLAGQTSQGDGLLRSSYTVAFDDDFRFQKRQATHTRQFLLVPNAVMEVLPEPEMKWEAPFSAINKRLVPMVRPIKK